MITVPSDLSQNPDTRPLPDGWVEQFDEKRQKWFYKQITLNPPRISYIHPLGPPRPTIATNRVSASPTSDHNEVKSYAQQMYRHASASPSSSGQVTPSTSSQPNLPPHMRRVLSEPDPSLTSGGQRLTQAQQIVAEVRGSSLTSGYPSPRTTSTSPRIPNVGSGSLISGTREATVVFRSPQFQTSAVDQSVYASTETFSRTSSQSTQTQSSFQGQQLPQSVQVWYLPEIASEQQVSQYQSLQTQLQPSSVLVPQVPASTSVSPYQQPLIQQPTGVSVPYATASPQIPQYQPAQIQPHNQPLRTQQNVQPAQPAHNTMQLVQDTLQAAKLGIQVYETVEQITEPQSVGQNNGNNENNGLIAGINLATRIAGLFTPNGGGAGRGSTANTSNTSNASGGGINLAGAIHSLASLNLRGNTGTPSGANATAQTNPNPYLNTPANNPPRPTLLAQPQAQANLNTPINNIPNLAMQGYTGAGPSTNFRPAMSVQSQVQNNSGIGNLIRPSVGVGGNNQNVGNGTQSRPNNQTAGIVNSMRPPVGNSSGQQNNQNAAIGNITRPSAGNLQGPNNQNLGNAVQGRPTNQSTGIGNTVRPFVGNSQGQNNQNAGNGIQSNTTRPSVGNPQGQNQNASNAAGYGGWAQTGQTNQGAFNGSVSGNNAGNAGSYAGAPGYVQGQNDQWGANGGGFAAQNDQGGNLDGFGLQIDNGYNFGPQLDQGGIGDGLTPQPDQWGANSGDFAPQGDQGGYGYGSATQDDLGGAGYGYVTQTDGGNGDQFAPQADQGDNGFWLAAQTDQGGNGDVFPPQVNQFDGNGDAFTVQNDQGGNGDGFATQNDQFGGGNDNCYNSFSFNGGDETVPAYSVAY